MKQITSEYQVSYCRVSLRDLFVRSRPRLVWFTASLLFLVSPGICRAEDTAVSSPVKEGERLDARSDEYSRVFDRAVNCLIDKNAACFRGMLSSFTVTQETRGPGAIDVIIEDRFIPYFSNFSKLSDRSATVPSYDAAGNLGIAICRSFITTGGEEKFFVLFVNVENGRYVVGNLLLDTKADQVVAMRATKPK